jgi:hypothetical protein
LEKKTWADCQQGVSGHTTRQENILATDADVASERAYKGKHTCSRSYTLGTGNSDSIITTKINLLKLVQGPTNPFTGDQEKIGNSDVLFMNSLRNNLLEIFVLKKLKPTGGGTLAAFY